MADPAPSPAFKRPVTVTNPSGLHLRAALAFAELAGRYRSTVVVRNGDRVANGKSGIDLVLLIALPGADLELEVAGPDAAEAMPVLAAQLGAASADLPGG